MDNEPTIELNTIYDRAQKVIQSNENHYDAFDVSMIVGAIVGLPKEYVLNQILDFGKKTD